MFYKRVNFYILPVICLLPLLEQTAIILIYLRGRSYILHSKYKTLKTVASDGVIIRLLFKLISGLIKMSKEMHNILHFYCLKKLTQVLILLIIIINEKVFTK